MSTVIRRCLWLLWAITLPLSAQTVEYIHTDALGSPVAVTDANRNVVERSEYEPYGALLNRPLTDGPGYTGHVADAATGLSYMQQRYYDPQIGRFLSVDPISANANTGAGFNRYTYVLNNPYKFTDPDGRCEKNTGSRICGSGGFAGSNLSGVRSIGPGGSAKPGNGQNDPGIRRSNEAWPAGSNKEINAKDKPGEGGGMYGDCRGRGCSRTHKGIDANGDPVTKIYAFRDGKVIRADNRDINGYGKQVIIEHADGITTRYAHLSSYSVEVGDEVRQSQQIGIMGRSGNTPSQGDTHIHFEVRGPGGTQDPLNYFPELKQ